MIKDIINKVFNMVETYGQEVKEAIVYLLSDKIIVKNLEDFTLFLEDANWNKSILDMLNKYNSYLDYLNVNELLWQYNDGALPTSIKNIYSALKRLYEIVQLTNEGIEFQKYTSLLVSLKTLAETMNIRSAKGLIQYETLDRRNHPTRYNEYKEEADIAEQLLSKDTQDPNGNRLRINDDGIDKIRSLFKEQQLGHKCNAISNIFRNDAQYRQDRASIVEYENRLRQHREAKEAELSKKAELSEEPISLLDKLLPRNSKKRITFN
jgi:hypothetical protein